VTALPALLADPAVLGVALLAVAVTGLSKGGMGGSFAVMGVPLLALTMPAVQAAALLLPVLMVMDAVGLGTWWRGADRAVLRALLPAAALGIGLGWMTAAVTPEAAVRLVVGLAALGFVARQMLRPPAPAEGARRLSAWVWGTATGFTSFVAHAGGPPFQMHVLPMRMAPTRYVATSAVFFAVVNAIKVAPYAALGLFEAHVLHAALWLAPVAVAGVLAGAWLARRIRAEAFYPIVHALLAVMGAKLVWDGVAGLL
jgi:uncharacterized protein